MRPALPVIDLGVYHFDPDREPEHVPPGPDWAHRARSARRWLPVGLVLLVTAVLAGGAVAPPESRLVRLWTVPATATDPFLLTGTTLYVAEAADAGVTMRAYGIADGTLRWEAPVDSAEGWASLTLAGEIPLVSAPRPGGDEFVTAYDPDTGQVRWSHRGWPHTILASDRVVLTRPLAGAWPVDDGSWPGDGRHPYEVALVDLHSGEVAWSQRFRVGELLLSAHGDAPARLTHVLTLTQQGRLTRYDPATGAVLASVDTPSTEQVWERMGTVAVSRSDGSSRPVPVPYAEVGQDEVVLAEREGLAGYDPVTLALRWRLSLPGTVRALPCGALICAFTESESGGTVEAMEPETGRLRWSRTCGEDLPGRRACLLHLRSPAPAGQLLLQGLSLDNDQARMVTWALELATGDLAAELPDWQLLGTVDGDQWLLTQSTDTSGPDEPHQQVWLARWAGGSTTPDVLGTIDATWCHSPAGDHLLCVPPEGGNPEVWRVR